MIDSVHISKQSHHYHVRLNRADLWGWATIVARWNAWDSTVSSPSVACNNNDIRAVERDPSRICCYTGLHHLGASIAGDPSTGTMRQSSGGARCLSWVMQHAKDRAPVAMFDFVKTSC